MLDISHKKAKGFTMVELLIVIAIIWVIASSANYLNFDDINNSKRVEVFSNSIGRSFENIRNNALYGRSLLTENPDAWRVSLDMTNSGTIVTEYLSWSVWSTYDDEESNYSVDFPAFISYINCDTSLDVSSGSGVVEYRWSELSFTGSCGITDKYMTIGTNYWWFTWEVIINSISGVIETRY